MIGRRTVTRTLLLTSVAAGCVASTACSRRLLAVVLDVPERPTELDPSTPTATPAGPLQHLPAELPVSLFNPADTVTPPLEETLDPAEVIDALPRDHAGNIDWVEALDTDVIRPRNGIDGPREARPGAFTFGFDFYFPGPNEMFDAYFPHSVHTEQIDCAQCHPRIFKTRGIPFTMSDVLGGKYCGECHGKVAFNPTTACERCHTAMTMPPDRAGPELLGTVTMRRATEILSEGDSLATVDGNAAGVRTDEFPRARFPHWVHRIRFQCKTCHMEIFEPRAGTNPVTMAQIDEGEACGRCHDNRTAFAPTLTNCTRCHPADLPVVAAPDGASP